MILQKDRAVLSSIFLPKALVGKTDVVFLTEKTDTARPTDQLVISFTNPFLSEGFRTDTFNYICNPDGSIRWVYPANLPNPNFLQFYCTASFRAKVISAFIKTAFFLGMKHLVASGKFYVSTQTETRIARSLNGSTYHSYSIFTGTEGKGRTFLAAIETNGRVSHFLKGAVDPTYAEALLMEHRQMAKSSSLKLNGVTIPKGSVRNGDLLMTNIRPQKNKQTAYLQDAHFHFIKQMYDNSVVDVMLTNSDILQTIKTGLSQVVSDSRCNENLARMIDAHRITLNLSDEIPMAMMHGDFTPWNMFLNNEQLHLIDWELSKDEAPMLFDLFHFVFQTERFLHNGTAETIDLRLQQMLEHPVAAQLISTYRIDTQLHLRLYLLYMVAYYVPEYQQQPSLSADQLAQIEIWTQHLARLTPELNKVSHRTVFLQSFAGALSNTDHAMLKFSETNITDLPVSSDLDILIKKGHMEQLLAFVAENSLVTKCRVERKSFMSIVRLFFEDGSFLSIDLIHSFKRKWHHFLDSEEVLKMAKADRWGIKRAHVQHDLEYSLLFYTLNGASIPSNYLQQFSDRCDGNQAATVNYINKRYGLKARSLQDLFLYTTNTHRVLKNAIANYAQNRGLRALANKFNYLLDTLKSMIHTQGMLITFSGVDGAGKSTIIEDIRTTLSQTYRKEVVVLRHRPAVLPILSAYKYGTNKANEISSIRLPRTGTNKSKIGSLARFSYYLLDYLFGQLYVKAKYTLRGKIVLYDRYYFDFIHDAKRTNIVLPPWFMKLFYPLISKPKLNFFLYAPSDVILARKQELNKSDIEDLTQRYSTHFDSLGKKYPKDIYHKIKNINRKQTVEMIIADYRAVA